MRIRVAIISVLAIVLYTTGASAINGTTFNITGTFSNGANLSGTYTVNTTTGLVTAANLVVDGTSAIAGTYNTIQSQQGQHGSGGDYYGVGLQIGSNIYPSFSFILPGYSLVGYTGGVCTNASRCAGYIASGIFPSATGNAIQLSSVSSSGGGTQPVPAISPWGAVVLMLLLSMTPFLLRRFRRA